MTYPVLRSLLGLVASFSAALAGCAVALIPAPAWGDETIATPVALAELPSELHVSANRRGSLGGGIAWPTQVLSFAPSEEEGRGWRAISGAEGPPPHLLSLRLVMSPELAGILPAKRGEEGHGAFRFRTTLRFVGPLSPANRAHVGVLSGIGVTFDTTAPPAVTFEAGLRFDAHPAQVGSWWARKNAAFRYPTVIVRTDVAAAARPASPTLTLALSLTFI